MRSRQEAEDGGAEERREGRLRVAAHNGAPVWGGAEIAVCRILVGLRERGHETRLYYNREEVGEPARRLFDLDTRRCHLGGDIALHHAFRFASELRRWAPDALVVGTFRKLLPAALGARWARVPRTVARIGMSTDTPRNAKYRFVLRRWVDWIVVNDRELRAAYRETLPGFPTDRLLAVHKGIGPPFVGRGAEGLRKELEIPPDAPVIGAVARLVSEKRLDRLLGVMAGLPPNVRCVVAGAGPLEEELRVRARSLEVADRVHFLGHREDVGDVLDLLDVLMVTSSKESLANAMLEALASGVPVISTPVSGAAEALEPLGALEARQAAAGEDEAMPDLEGARPGLIVAPEVAALAAAARQVLGDDTARLRMARAAGVRARSRFAPEAMLDAWEAVLGGGRPPGSPGAGTSLPAPSRRLP